MSRRGDLLVTATVLVSFACLLIGFVMLQAGCDVEVVILAFVIGCYTVAWATFMEVYLHRD